MTCSSDGCNQLRAKLWAKTGIRRLYALKSDEKTLLLPGKQARRQSSTSTTAKLIRSFLVQRPVLTDLWMHLIFLCFPSWVRIFHGMAIFRHGHHQCQSICKSLDQFWRGDEAVEHLDSPLHVNFLCPTIKNKYGFISFVLNPVYLTFRTSTPYCEPSESLRSDTPQEPKKCNSTTRRHGHGYYCSTNAARAEKAQLKDATSKPQSRATKIASSPPKLALGKYHIGK